MYLLSKADVYGMPNDLAGVGTAMFVALVFTVTLKLCMRTHTWTWITHLVYWISLALLFPFIYMLSNLWPNTSGKGLANMTGVAEKLFSRCDGRCACAETLCALVVVHTSLRWCGLKCSHTRGWRALPATVHMLLCGCCILVGSLALCLSCQLLYLTATSTPSSHVRLCHCQPPQPPPPRPCSPLLHSPVFWMSSVVCAPVMSLLPDLAVLLYRRSVKPDIIALLQVG